MSRSSSRHALASWGVRMLGLADDLHQRDARAVEVDLGEPPGPVGELAGVLLQVDPGQATPAAPRAVLLGRDLQPPAGAEREVVLADLVVLGQVGIVVVLPVPLGEAGDLGMERDRRLERQLERLAVHDRQGPRHPERDRVGLRVGRQPELGPARREHLALGGELDVDFEADDDRIVHVSAGLVARKGRGQVARGGAAPAIRSARRSRILPGARRPRKASSRCCRTPLGHATKSPG